MHNHPWSPSEKKLARTVFQRALERELAERVADFKQRAAQVESAEDMWALRGFIERAQRDIERRYDFRWSQLLFVFGVLHREGRINDAELQGLSEDKLSFIRGISAL